MILSASFCVHCIFPKLVSLSGEDVCCNVVGVSVYSVMCSEFLITSPVRTECGMFMMCCLEEVYKCLQ